MLMKPHRALPFLLLTAGILNLSPGIASELTDEEAIQVARSVIRADRQAVVAEILQLTAAESERFWPLYHQYRAEMDEIADRLLRVVQEYAAHYPDVPDNRAKQMLKELTGLEKKQAATRASYLKKIGKILPAAEGAKPGGLVAETRRATATVTAIDPQKRTATLRFEDGSTKTLPVRRDVDLSQDKVGEQVVFRVTEMVAVSMVKP